MTYVVTEACIKCKYMDCIEVCPTDCFHEGENMLMINPEPCIDCGVCVPECPIDAIQPDTNPHMADWVLFNREYALRWPQITRKGNPPIDADAWKDIPDKMAHFSENPGKKNISPTL